ncbi:epimerase [Shimia sp.]|uniref:epimerase n=1 Tax=Shimia sp. TaxID=1954381 RepID=UPI003B8D157D
MAETVLILGANGRFGRHAAEAFAKAGWVVQRFDRSKDVLREAVHGVQVIVNAWNPEYPDWESQVPKLHAEVIDAAKTVDATVIVPGNVYVFGAGTPSPWGVTTAHQARNPLGQIRRDMEQAYRDSGVRTIVLRSGDFIDTKASGNWFDMIMAKKISRGLFTYPGRRDVEHAWAYLPDVCRAAVGLAEKRTELNRFEDVCFAGYTLTGDELIQALEAVLRRSIKVRTMPWWALKLAAPFWKLAPFLLEMRYLWNTPHRLDGARFEAVLPGFEHTELHVALASALPDEIGRSQKSMSAQTI